MSNRQLLERLHQLEKEIELLKTQIRPTRKSFFVQAPRVFIHFIISHWPLISVLFAVLTLLYVKAAFNVDYFDDYRNISTTKKLSEFYRQMGDKMMENGEWIAAEEAYLSALELNSNNIEATYGIAKAQVFQPLEGNKYYAPEVANVKLEYLFSLFPDDYQLYFLKGNQYLNQMDDKNAELWFQKSVAKNPRFAAGYVNLGYIKQRELDFEEAIKDFEKALELDSDNALAHNNVGYMYFLLAKFDLAFEHLATAYSLSPSLLTAINLGNAYRQMGDFTAGLRLHQHAQSVMNEPDVESERYVGGLWLFNFMPQELGDLETIKYYVQVGSASQKQIFLHYLLSFDYALTGDYSSANREFETGNQLDLGSQYSSFFINEIASIKSSLGLNGEALLWFDEHMYMLAFSQ